MKKLKNHFKINKKLLSLVLLFVLTISLVGMIRPVGATENASSLPPGKNYIEIANFYLEFGMEINSYDDIKVKPNTDYTISDKVPMNGEIIIDIDSGATSLLNFEGTGEDLYYGLTFNTGVHESISIQIISFDEYTTEILDTLQLEEGTVKTSYELYGVISDNTAPVVTGGGVHLTSVDDPDTVLEIQSTLTAVDETDGNVAANFTITSNAYTGNEAILGDYQVDYQVQDAAGNIAVINVIVRVVDITAPIIQVSGSLNMYIEYGGTYTESDYQNTVHDNYDAEIDYGAVITGTVNTNVLGTYYVYYNATDSSGNEATQIVRTVIVGDQESPTLELAGSFPTYIEYGDTYTEGINAVHDNYDGTTNNGVIVTGSVNSMVLGTYYVHYNATDSSGNDATEIIRTVIVQDTTPAVLTLNGSSTITLEYGDSYSELGANFSDTYDGSGTAIITGSVNDSILGTYHLTYNYTDSSGNVSSTISRTVIIQDTTSAVLTFNGLTTVYVEFGDTYTELNVDYSDIHDGTGVATITGTVNINVLGTYNLSYSYTDSSGNASSTLSRTVIVRDTTSPIIQVGGSLNMYIEYGGTYIESTYQNTVHDNYDAEIDYGAVITGTVDSSTIGVYSIYYNATDSNGNIADTITRIVTIQDTTPAALTLNGASTVFIEFGLQYEELDADYFDVFDGTGIATITGTVNVGVLGVYELYYNYTDSNGNISTTEQRTITVQDTLSPYIFGGTEVIIWNSDNNSVVDVVSRFIAYDYFDGDVSSSIVVTSDTYTGHENQVGLYLMTVTVTDTNSNELIFNFEIEVKDDVAPVVAGSSYLVSLETANSMTQAEIKAHILG